jgi:hypothetical protein
MKKSRFTDSQILVTDLSPKNLNSLTYRRACAARRSAESLWQTKSPFTYATYTVLIFMNS